MALAGPGHAADRALKEWSVAITAVAEAPPDGPLAAGLISALRAHGPAVALRSHGVDVRFDVRASSPVVALRRALVMLRAAAPHLDPVAAAVETIEELERRLAASNVPELVGVAEAANLLGCSRQWVSELGRAPGFPATVARLRCGPIWLRGSIEGVAHRQR